MNLLAAFMTAPLSESLWLGLMTENGEAEYTGYARTIIPRTAEGWSADGDTAINAVAVTWPICTGGDARVVGVGIFIGAADSDPVTIVPARLAISENIRPELSAGNLILSLINLGA